MALEIIYQTVNDAGEYTCEGLGISAQEWLEILQASEASNYLDTLCCFLREPEHTATCSELSLKYGNTASHYSAKVTQFSKMVQRKLNRFQIMGTDGKETYWPVTMQKGWNSKTGYKWQLRDELVEALRKILVNGLIDKLRNAEPFNGNDERFKWKLLDNTEGKNEIEIIKNITGGNRTIDYQRLDKILKYLTESVPIETTKVIKHLLDETIPLNTRIATYKKEMREICSEQYKIYPNDERTAAAILTCRYPNKYTFYKDDVYQKICRYLGIESHPAGKKFSHFMEIINKITAEYGEEIQELLLPQIEKFRNKPLNLAVQTLFWCLKDEMKNTLDEREKTYWLAGYSYGGNDSQLDRFLEDEIWEFGYDENNKTDKQLVKDAKKFTTDDIIILKSTSTKGPKHDQPFLRIKAIGIVKSAVTFFTDENGIKRGQCSVEYIDQTEKDFDGKNYGKYRNTLHVADEKTKDIIDYVNELLNNKNMTPRKYQQYIDLLETNHNLVLTGAPGTGKTHMAHAIAREMEAETRFVQFHPSYDYTDFVEGLRPVEKENGQMGFERRDGVFKEFCREALKNLIDSKKSVESLSREMSWQEQLNQFIDDAIETGKKFTTVNGSEFTIQGLKEQYIIVINENNKTAELAVNTDEVLDLLTSEVKLDIVKDIRNHFGRKFGTQADSYTFVITNAVKAMKTQLPAITASKVDRKPFVFIIDEINRGEASKIFGELFFAIDPGYRGKQEQMVQTQYQNLIPGTDVFAHGFYVPENVYILATMNDIDRSVESMDFAMRRRFTWKEITPADTEAMLDDLSCAEQARETMHRLNEVIAETDGLGGAYMIGPAYFLKLKDNGGDFDRLWAMNIEPLLKEYLRGFRKADEVLETFRTAYFNTAEPQQEPIEEQ